MTSSTAVLVLEIYQWQILGAVAAQSDLRTSAVARLSRARSRGMAETSDPDQALGQFPKGPATLARATVSSASSSSGSSNSSGGKLGTIGQIPQIGSDSQSDAESDSASRASGGSRPSSGTVLVPLGVARFPLRHIPEDRKGVVTELDGEVRGGSAEGVQEGYPCVIEVQAWDAAQYSAEQLKGQDAKQPMTDEPGISLDLITSPAYATHMISILTEDLVSKQTALDKLQRAVLRAEGSSQLGLWRMHEAEKRNRVLAADLAQLRKLLHEEKSSSKVNLLLITHYSLLTTTPKVCECVSMKVALQQST